MTRNGILSGFSKMAARYTPDEYEQLSEDLTGSLVTLGIKGENCGVGIVVNHRRWYGHFHVYVFWITSPYIKFNLQRQTGWHEFERLTILSKPR